LRFCAYNCNSCSMKSAMLSVLAVLALSLSECAGDGSFALTNSAQVVNILNGVKGWTDNGSYTVADWSHLTNVASVIRRTDPQVVSQGLDEFTRICDSTNGGYLDLTKAYLLMRVLFDLPTNAPASVAHTFPFANYVTWGKEVNSDGTVNLSWPVGWSDGRPFICSSFWGAEGPPYFPAVEYTYLRTHFKYRRLNVLPVSNGH
jgi:hypothetical protein